VLVRARMKSGSMKMALIVVAVPLVAAGCFEGAR
jgi:hypothetical protein